MKRISWLIKLSQATAFISSMKTHFIFAACVNTTYSKPSKENYRMGKGGTSRTLEKSARLDILHVGPWVYLTDLLAADDTSGIYYFLQGYNVLGDHYNKQKILFWKIQRASLKYFSLLTTLPSPNPSNCLTPSFRGVSLFSPLCPPNKYWPNVDHSKEYE